MERRVILNLLGIEEDKFDLDSLERAQDFQHLIMIGKINNKHELNCRQYHRSMYTSYVYKTWMVVLKSCIKAKAAKGHEYIFYCYMFLLQLQST